MKNFIDKALKPFSGNLKKKINDSVNTIVNS